MLSGKEIQRLALCTLTKNYTFKSLVRGGARCDHTLALGKFNSVHWVSRTDQDIWNYTTHFLSLPFFALPICDMDLKIWEIHFVSVVSDKRKKKFLPIKDVLPETQVHSLTNIYCTHENNLNI
jgi:hypothetical protein